MHHFPGVRYVTMILVLWRRSGTDSGIGRIHVRVRFGTSGVELIFDSCPQCRNSYWPSKIRPPNQWSDWMECGILILHVGIVMTFALCLRSNQARPASKPLGCLFPGHCQNRTTPSNTKSNNETSWRPQTGIPPKPVYLSFFGVLLVNFNHGACIKTPPRSLG